MTGLIILAAGQSSRMGQPKQKLQYKGKSLLQHAVVTATASACQPVVVVLGAYAHEVLALIKNEPVTIIHNTQWQQGMASSIKTGILELEKNSQVTDVLIMLCDQPFVTPELINSLIKHKEQTRKGIVACAYHSTTGVPVLFGRAYFSELLLLQGHEGAKKLLTLYKDDVALVPFALGEIDIDTMTDYEKLL